jgi:hypothetical protein
MSFDAPTLELAQGTGAGGHTMGYVWKNSTVTATATMNEPTASIQPPMTRKRNRDFAVSDEPMQESSLRVPSPSFLTHSTWLHLVSTSADCTVFPADERAVGVGLVSAGTLDFNHVPP